jgi:hypothetical protein
MKEEEEFRQLSALMTRHCVHAIVAVSGRADDAARHCVRPRVEGVISSASSFYIYEVKEEPGKGEEKGEELRVERGKGGGRALIDVIRVD